MHVYIDLIVVIVENNEMLLGRWLMDGPVVRGFFFFFIAECQQNLYWIHLFVDL